MAREVGWVSRTRVRNSKCTLWFVPPPKLSLRLLTQSCDDAEAASVGDGGRQLREAHVVHPALYDRVADAQGTGEPGMQHHGRGWWAVGESENGKRALSGCPSEVESASPVKLQG